MPNSVLSGTLQSLSHFIFSHKLSGKYFYHSHFIEEEFEYQLVNLFTQVLKAKDLNQGSSGFKTIFLCHTAMLKQKTYSKYGVSRYACLQERIPGFQIFMATGMI